MRWLGHVPTIEYPQMAPRPLAEVLEPDGMVVSPELIMPGRLCPLSGTKVDDRGCKLAGYIEYAGVHDPVVRGSLVMIVGSEAEYRVMALRGHCYDLLRNSQDSPTRLYLVSASSVRQHLRERRRVNHPDGGASTTTRFGEPGLVGGPGHQSVLREIGVTWFTARELWRPQHADVAEADAREQPSWGWLLGGHRRTSRRCRRRSSVATARSSPLGEVRARPERACPSSPVRRHGRLRAQQRRRSRSRRYGPARQSRCEWGCTEICAAP